MKPLVGVLLFGEVPEVRGWSNLSLIVVVQSFFIRGNVWVTYLLGFWGIRSGLDDDV